MVFLGLVSTDDVYACVTRYSVCDGSCRTLRFIRPISGPIEHGKLLCLCICGEAHPQQRGDIDFEPHIPAVVLHPPLRRALGIDECTYRGKVSFLRHSLFLIPWTLQVAKNYSGILAARIFVGVPEVSVLSINT